MTFILSLLLALLITVPTPFWEAYVAMCILRWWVPVSLPVWLNWWTLGWVNMAVSVMIRQYQWTPLTTETGMDSVRRMGSMLNFSYTTPLAALFIAWIVKQLWT